MVTHNGGKSSLPEHQDEVKKLIKFVDENFQPIRLRDILRASEMLTAIVITLVILLVYIFALVPFTPIAEQIPWAISFSVLVLASASLAATQTPSLRMRLINQQFRRMHPHLDEKGEQIELLLRALLNMKIRNPRIKLLTVYEMDKLLFDKGKLLERLYE